MSSDLRRADLDALLARTEAGVSSEAGAEVVPRNPHEIADELERHATVLEKGEVFPPGMIAAAMERLRI